MVKSGSSFEDLPEEIKKAPSRLGRELLTHAVPPNFPCPSCDRQAQRPNRFNTGIERNAGSMPASVCSARSLNAGSSSLPYRGRRSGMRDADRTRKRILQDHLPHGSCTGSHHPGSLRQALRAYSSLLRNKISIMHNITEHLPAQSSLARRPPPPVPRNAARRHASIVRNPSSPHRKDPPSHAVCSDSAEPDRTRRDGTDGSARCVSAPSIRRAAPHIRRSLAAHTANRRDKTGTSEVSTAI